MQPVNASPRNTLTPAEVTDIIAHHPDVTIGSGVEIVDNSLAVVQDITEWLAIGGKVSRSSYAEVHGSCTLPLSIELDWGAAKIRPYYTMTHAGVTARFNLGVYYPSTPPRQLGEQPPTWDVTGYDIVQGLQDKIGGAYSIDAGYGYLQAVEDIFLNRGFVVYYIDQQATASTLPQPKVWAFDASITWLSVVNELLGAVGYAGVWSDWDGALRCGPYETPQTRLVEWYYDISDETAMMAPEGSIEFDFYDAPNRWVFYRTNMDEGVTPVEGAGVFTYQNDLMGPTSVQERGGRVLTAEPQGVEAADQAALVARAQLTIDADLRLKRTLTRSTFPNPLHWHFDRVLIDDPDVGPPVDALDTAWELPLDGGDMTHTWTFLD